MPRRKEPTKLTEQPLGRALSPEARQDQLIALAYDLVEQRLRDGTATSQETVHFLRMGSTKEKLEERILEEDCKLRRAKTEAIEVQKRIEGLYEEAISAVKSYRGYREAEFYEEDIS